MGITGILKRTWLYTKLYHPYRVAQRKKMVAEIREHFRKEGTNVLKAFVSCMNAHGITYWLEFGTLLGAYRDKDYVPNEMDLDVGLFLSDAKKAYEALIAAGFHLIREFHVVGENGLEQTYEYLGTTIDLMFFYSENDLLWCNGALFPSRIKLGKLIECNVTSHHFKSFICTEIEFKGIKVSVPANTEEHIIEIYGPGYKVYDPNFTMDYNKTIYPIEEKRAIGFIDRII